MSELILLTFNAPRTKTQIVLRLLYRRIVSSTLFLLNISRATRIICVCTQDSRLLNPYHKLK